MKIYLLLLLVGALFMAIRLTSRKSSSRNRFRSKSSRLRQRQERPPLQNLRHLIFRHA
ncbi:hypothetical protein ACQ5SK_32035 [Bradyrhizobium japonicum]